MARLGYRRVACALSNLITLPLLQHRCTISSIHISVRAMYRSDIGCKAREVVQDQSSTDRQEYPISLR